MRTLNMEKRFVAVFLEENAVLIYKRLLPDGNRPDVSLSPGAAFPTGDTQRKALQAVTCRAFKLVTGAGFEPATFRL